FPFDTLDLRRNDLQGLRHLADHRVELGVEQGRNVEFTCGEKRLHLLRDLAGLRKADILDFAIADGLDDLVRKLALEDVMTLATNGQRLDRLAFAERLEGMIARETCDRRVDAASEATLAGGHDEKTHLVLAIAAQQHR